MNKKAKYIDRKMLELFASNKPFTQNLTKWQDDILKDKYDHNFIKLECDFPLKNSFGIEEGITLDNEIKRG